MKKFSCEISDLLTCTAQRIGIENRSEQESNLRIGIGIIKIQTMPNPTYTHTLSLSLSLSLSVSLCVTHTHNHPLTLSRTVANLFSLSVVGMVTLVSCRDELALACK